MIYNQYFKIFLKLNLKINYKLINFLYYFYNIINNKPLYICIFYNNIFIVCYSLSTYIIIKSKYIKNKIK